MQARDQGGVVFDSGGYTADDEIADVADELRQPHANLVTEPSQVVVWELIALDPEGEPTTYLSRMAGVGKDTRLLPKGWRRDGPHAATTAPVGIGNDVDFTAGGDTVSFAVPVGQHGGPATVTAWVHYQTIPPHWVAPMRRIDAVECRTFVAMYDAADKTPETAGVAVRSEGG
ncbi:MAG: hypothetical protein FJ265_05970 [Planctomycetes bacterium]|nr:hypothetical protein [Planctomycetota bacterium]